MCVILTLDLRIFSPFIKPWGLDLDLIGIFIIFSNGSEESDNDDEDDDEWDSISQTSLDDSEVNKIW